LYTASPVSDSGYRANKNIPVTFISPQNPISSSFVLMGAKGPGGDYGEWSFEATITSVTTTSANLNISPRAIWGAVINVHFGVVILNQCGGGIELRHFSNYFVT
jgi:hypothetical protein